MTTQSIKILFVISATRINKKGLVPLVCRITYLSKRKPFASGLFINPNNWNNALQQAIPIDIEHIQINTKLSLIKQEINQAFLFLQVQKNEFDVDDIYLKYKGEDIKPAKSLMEVFELHNSRMKMLIGKEYTNKGNVADNTDDYKSIIVYYSGLNNNLINIPKIIYVYAGEFMSLARQREVSSVNNNTGDILSVKVLLALYNDYAQTDMTYDVYGNLKTVTYPQTSFGQQIHTYTYDTVLHKYLTEVEDVLGYKSSSTYDENFDVVKRTTDITGNSINYNYDNLGRLTKIIAPKEANNSDPYTISFAYMPTYAQVQANSYSSFVSQANFIPFAVTKHYDAQHPNDPIETVNFVDGLGRNIQVKKDIEVNTGTPSSPTYSQQMSVSGYVTNDIWGRTIKTYQQRSENKSNTINYLVNQAATPNSSFSTVEYDVLDRTTKSIDYEGNESTLSYTIANDPYGTLAFKTRRVVQQNGSADLINESFTDVKGQNISTLNAGSIKTKFNYDAIGQLISYTDDENISTTYEYDLAGRKLQVNHPDNGTTRYGYNRAGNIEEIRTDNLSQLGGDPIFYEYDTINRLIAIKYPILQSNGQDNIANVKYEYGAPSCGYNKEGRIIKQYDATGMQEFDYGNMGETTSIKRTIVAPNLPTRVFDSKFNYDSFNRIQDLTYPDGEIVTYFYNKGGNLNKMTTKIDGSDYDYIKQIDYDYFDQKTYMKYGNNTETFYNYSPELRRLQNLNVKASDGQDIFNNVYSYDKVGNITNIHNDATYNTTNYMGGEYNNDYTYDNLNRLTEASGAFKGYTSGKGIIGQSDYTLTMAYNTTHGITQKRQVHSTQGYALVSENTYVNNYDYQQGTHKVTNITNDETSLTESFEYDTNGNMLQSSNVDGFRRMYWDESNRLRVVNDNDNIMQHYIYDANGERILKASSQIESVYENGQIDASSTTMGLYTTYVNSYMVVDANQHYSKHYFNGSQRVASRFGNEDISIFETEPEIPQEVPSELKNQTKNKGAENTETTDFNALKNLQIADFNYYLGKNTNKGKNVKVKYAEYKKVEEPVENTIGKSTENTTQAMPVNIEVYYYHSDHLGSGTFLSDGDGNPYQFFLNLPFGETMMEQHSYTGDYTNRYKFNGKELDEETGFYYYGARYYNPKFSIWLSTDPLAEKYPSWNPYNYCMQNPINLIDPTGMAPEDEWIPGTDGERISYSKNENGEVVWSSNTSEEMKELGNAMLTTEKGTKQLNTALDSDDVMVGVVINEGRKEGESGALGITTFGTTTPKTYDDKNNPTKITSGEINLYPKAYSDKISSEYSQYLTVTYDGETFKFADYSVMQNLSTTFGHEIDHMFNPDSSSALNKLKFRTTNVEENPNKVSKEIYQQLKK